MIRLSGRLVCMTEEERSAVLLHRPAHVQATLAEPGLTNMIGPRFYGWVMGAPIRSVAVAQLDLGSN